MKYVVTSHVDVGNNSQKLMDTYTLMSWVSEKLIFFNQNMLKEISSAFWCRSLWSKHSGNKSGSHAPFTRVVAWGCQMCSANILKVMHYCLWFDIMSMYFALMIEYKDCMVCRGDDVPGPGIFSDYTTGDWHSVPAYWPETPNGVKLRNSQSVLLAYMFHYALLFIPAMIIYSVHNISV